MASERARSPSSPGAGLALVSPGGQHHHLLSSARSLPNSFMHKQNINVAETYV